MIKDKLEVYDVVIAGGGVSGSVAAIAAARNGARTLLIEKHAFLGGSLTAMGVGPMMTFHNRAGEQVIKGLPQQLVERLMARGASPGHIEDTTTYCSTVTPFDSEALKAELETMILEAGGALLYHTQLAGVTRAGDRIESIQVCSKGGLRSIGASLFIDATGDGDLAAQAGVPFVLGREGDSATQPMTMNMKIANVEIARLRAFVEANPDDFSWEHGAEEGLARLKRAPRVSLNGFIREWEAAKASGEITVPRERVLFFETATPGVVIINTSRVQGLNPTDPYQLTLAEIEGRKQNHQIFAFLRKYCAGFENAIRCDSSAQIGVREGRHMQGHYTLTAGDLLSQTPFPDAIALGGYPIDIHSPDGDVTLTTHLRPTGAYSIPYRCLIPLEPRNLLAVGRCVSATHEAFAAIRVTPIAMAIGQAGGTAAALCARDHIDPVELDPETLRAVLVKQGACLSPLPG